MKFPCHVLIRHGPRSGFQTIDLYPDLFILGFDLLLPVRHILLTRSFFVARVTRPGHGAGDRPETIQHPDLFLYRLDVAAGTFHVRQKHRAENSIHRLVLHGILSGVDGALNLVRLTVTVLAVHHDRHRFDLLLTVRDFTVTRKALHLVAPGMRRMQLHAVRLVVFAIAMTVMTLLGTS